MLDMAALIETENGLLRVMHRLGDAARDSSFFTREYREALREDIRAAEAALEVVRSLIQRS